MPVQAIQPMQPTQPLPFVSNMKSHTDENRKLIREIESLNRKVINGKAAVAFNEHCYTNNLLPSYTNIFVLCMYE